MEQIGHVVMPWIGNMAAYLGNDRVLLAAGMDSVIIFVTFRKKKIRGVCGFSRVDGGPYGSGPEKTARLRSCALLAGLACRCYVQLRFSSAAFVSAGGIGFDRVLFTFWQAITRMSMKTLSQSSREPRGGSSGSRDKFHSYWEKRAGRRLVSP